MTYLSSFVWIPPPKETVPHFQHAPGLSATLQREKKKKTVFKVRLSWIWCLTSVIPAFQKVRQDALCEFKACLGHTVSLRPAGAIQVVPLSSVLTNPAKPVTRSGGHELRFRD